MSAVVGVSACRMEVDGKSHQVVQETYTGALWAAAGCASVLIPAAGAAGFDGSLIDRLDGLVLTGSPSNVQPQRYGGARARAGTLEDPHRDATTLELVRRAIARGLPVLAICRGCQELNVALGGTLQPHVEAAPGRLHHCERLGLDPDTAYTPAHGVEVREGGRLARWGLAGRIEVSSLHFQGLAALGKGLRVEAVAEDGLVEAVSLEGAPAPVLGVQWHPEWRSLADPVSRCLLERFGEAARTAAERCGRAQPRWEAAGIGRRQERGAPAPGGVDASGALDAMKGDGSRAELPRGQRLVVHVDRGGRAPVACRVEEDDGIAIEAVQRSGAWGEVYGLARGPARISTLRMAGAARAVGRALGEEQEATAEVWRALRWARAWLIDGGHADAEGVERPGAVGFPRAGGGAR